MIYKRKKVLSSKFKILLLIFLLGFLFTNNRITQNIYQTMNIENFDEFNNQNMDFSTRLDDYLAEENSTLIQSQADDLFITGSDIVSIANNTYNNIYIFDQAQVTLNNITVENVIEACGTGTLLIENGGSTDQLLVHGNVSATIINSYEIKTKVIGDENSSITILNSTMTYWHNEVYYDQSCVQISNSNIDGQISLYDGANLNAYNSSIKYLNLYQESHAVLNLLSIYSKFYMYASSSVYINNSIFEKVELFGTSDKNIPGIEFYANNLSVSDKIYISQNVSATFENSNINPAISCWTDNEDSIAPKLTFKSTNATLTKNTDAILEYNNTVEELTISNSDVSILFINIQLIRLSNGANAKFFAASYDNYVDLDGTGTIQTGLSGLVDRNYFITENSQLILNDQTYKNIYIFDQAQVTLNNITVENVIEAYGTGTLLIENGGSTDQLLVHGNVSAIIINSYEIKARLLGDENSSITILNSTMIDWHEEIYHDQSCVLISNSNINGQIFLYDGANLNAYNLSIDYLNIYQESHAVLNFLSISIRFYMRDYSSVYINNSIFEKMEISGSNDKNIPGIEFYANNLSVSDKIYISQNVSATFENSNINPAISCWTDNEDSIAPKLTFKSTNATLTKNTDPILEYNNTVEELTISNSDVSILFIYIQKIAAYNNSKIKFQDSEYGTIYLDLTSAIVGNDYDFDGLSDDAENQVYFTNPDNPDSDGDGYGDGEEIQFGGDPKDSLNFPADVDYPSIIISEISNQSIYHQNIYCELDAFDNRGIDNVSVILDNSMIYFEEVPFTTYWLNATIDCTIEIDTKEYSDGNHSLKFVVYDIHHHRTELNYNLVFDNTPVYPNLIGPGSIANNSYTRSGIILEFEFSESPQIVLYSWDGGLNNSILQAIPSGDGIHYLDIFTSDFVGNWLHTQYTFYVDDTSVLVELLSPSNNSYVHSNTVINLEFSKTPSAVYYSWDGNLNNSELTPIPSTQGIHILEIWTNSSTGVLFHTQFKFIVDDYAPNIILINPEVNTTHESGTLINITFNEDIQTVYYSWDGGDNFTTIPYLPLGDGIHYLDVNVCDFVPNWNYTRFYFRTDDPLIIELISPAEGSVLPSNTMINLTVMGSLGTYTYNWDNEVNQTVPLSEMPYTPIHDGDHFLNIFASDDLGNSISHSYFFVVQNPLIQIILISPEMNSILSSETAVQIEFSETPAKVFYSWNGGINETELRPIPGIKGEYILDVYAQSIHGPWSHAQFRWVVEYNNVPTVELIYPTGGEIVSNSITIVWQGNDLDNDYLTYTLYCRVDYDIAWYKIANNIDKESYFWDISNIPNGKYFIKVIVSDGKSENTDILMNAITIYNENNYENSETTSSVDNSDGNSFEDFTMESIPGFSLKILFGIGSIALYIEFLRRKNILRGKNIKR